MSDDHAKHLVEAGIGALSELSRRGGGAHMHTHGVMKAGEGLVRGAAWVAPGAVAAVSSGTATVVSGAVAVAVAAAPVVAAVAAGAAVTYAACKLWDWLDA